MLCIKKFRATFVSIASLILIFSCFFVEAGRDFQKQEKLLLGGTWTFEKNYGEKKDIDIIGFQPDFFMKGDHLEIERILPETGIKYPVLSYFSVFSKVRMFLDKELILDFSGQTRNNGSLLGYGKIYADLPHDYAGKTLRIVIDVTEDRAFNSITAPVIENGKKTDKTFMIENEVVIFINIFLFVFGIIIFFISSIFSIRAPKFFYLVFLGCFSFSISLWSMCYHGILQLFTYNLQAKTYCEYISLFFCPLYILLFFLPDFRKVSLRPLKIFYYILLNSLVAFLAVSCILNFTDTLHFPQTLIGCHAYILVSAFCVVFLIIHERKFKEKKYSAIGFILFTVFVASDVLMYNFIKLFCSSNDFVFTSYLSVGTLILIISMFVDFFIDFNKSSVYSMRMKTLEEMAYTDIMTGLSNRRRYEEELLEINGSGLDYGVASLDLNGLKATNDILGHEAGDRLIKACASVLTKTFGDKGIVCRIGGDEFAVLFKDIGHIDCSSLFSGLKDNIEETNSETGMNLSMAAGFCKKSEYPEADIQEIFRIADNRMYIEKKRMKAGENPGASV